MTIIWQLPDSKYKIAEFINYLLNSQDTNTLIHNLLNLNLAHYANSEIRSDLPHYILINLNINLTTKGFKEREKIYDFVHKYLELIKQTIQKNPEIILDIYKDFKTIINNNFLNWELDDNLEYTQQLSALWTTKDISVEKLISYEYTYLDADTNYLEMLNSFLEKYFVKFEDNVLLQSKYFKGLTDKIEKWYNIPYKLISPMEQFINYKFLVYKQLKLPSKNEYITEFKYEDIECDETKQEDPILIQEDEYHELYYKYSCKLNDLKTMIFMYLKLKKI
jgi:secreted Zn-dependent insulinase-like peptidase